MPEEKKLRRAFKGDDNLMLQTVWSIHNLFVEDMAAFAAFDPSFTSAWADEWSAGLDAAMASSKDHIVRAEAMFETESIVGSMNAARAKWADVKYFVQKAFPGDATMRTYFGSGVYTKVGRSQPRMLEFLKGLQFAALEYATPLLDAGYTQAGIDEIGAICMALSDKNDAQNAAIRGRPKATAARIAALNAPYLRMVLVNRAAQIVFSNSYAKRKQYTYGYKPQKKRVKKAE